MVWAKKGENVDDITNTQNNKAAIGFELIENVENKELCKSILNMFQTVPQGMTSFQIQNFVLSNKSFPTADSKWWQAKLELWVRVQNVIQMHYDYRKFKAKIKEFTARVLEHQYMLEANGLKSYEIMKSEAIIDRLTVNIEENEFLLVITQKGINDKLKEINAFWEVMQEMGKHMKFSMDDKEEQEESFWLAKSKYDSELINRFPELFKGSQKQSGAGKKR